MDARPVQLHGRRLRRAASPRWDRGGLCCERSPARPRPYPRRAGGVHPSRLRGRPDRPRPGRGRGRSRGRRNRRPETPGPPATRRRCQPHVRSLARAPDRNPGPAGSRSGFPGRGFARGAGRRNAGPDPRPGGRLGRRRRRRPRTTGARGVQGRPPRRAERGQVEPVQRPLGSRRRHRHRHSRHHPRRDRGPTGDGGSQSHSRRPRRPTGNRRPDRSRRGSPSHRVGRGGRSAPATLFRGSWRRGGRRRSPPMAEGRPPPPRHRGGWPSRSSPEREYSLFGKRSRGAPFRRRQGTAPPSSPDNAIAMPCSKPQRISVAPPVSSIRNWRPRRCGWPVALCSGWLDGSTLRPYSAQCSRPSA